MTCDVTKPESIAEAVKQIEQETEHVDILINNAGITGPIHYDLLWAQSIQEVQSILQRQWGDWDDTWRTNTSSIVAVSAALLHLLDKANEKRGWVTGRRQQQHKISGDLTDRRTSQIITVTSVAAFNRQITGGLAYAATKSGAVMVGKIMATFLAPFGIRSNIIAPGSKCRCSDIRRGCSD